MTRLFVIQQMAEGLQPPASCQGVQDRGTRNLMVSCMTSVEGHMLKCSGRRTAQVVSFNTLCHWQTVTFCWEEAIVYWYQFISAGHGPSSSTHGHSTDGARKPLAGTSASGRQPLRAVHSLSLPTNITSLGSSGKEIRFYNRDDPYYEFTNFYRAPIQADGHTWPTTEHYFQAQKFVGTPYVGVIRKLTSAREAFQLARDPKVSRWRRSDWDGVKDDVMLKALRLKFMQHDKLQRKLLETGDKTLIEHTTNDSYWGDGGDGSGRNMLGKLLMQVRGDLRAKYGNSALVKAPRSSMFDSSHSTYHRFLPAKDDSAVPSSAPTTHLSSRKRSASYSNLAGVGLSEGHSRSRPPLSELGCSEHWKMSRTLGSGFTTSHPANYQSQKSDPKKTKSTSTSSKYFSSPPTTSQYHPSFLKKLSPPSSSNPSQHHSGSAKPSTSPPSSTVSNYYPSFPTSLPSNVSRTVRAVASPMLSRKQYSHTRPLPPDPSPSSSSSASTDRRRTNQSSVGYDIITGRRRHWCWLSAVW